MLGTGEQKLVTSEKRILKIGRLPSSEIFIDDPVVSRRHAEVYLAEEGYFLRDTGSRNGTFLNGERVFDPAVLKPGDVIGVGSSRVVYEPSDSVAFLKDGDDAQSTSAISLSEPTPEKLASAPVALLEAVAEVARKISDPQPLETLLNSILQVCLEKTAAQRGAIMLIEDDGDLKPKAYISTSRAHEKFAISRTIANQAIRENKAILIRDVEGDEHLKMSESIASLKIRSAICTPLWNGERTVGILYVDTTEHTNLFNETDLYFFSALTGLIAEKIENALLAEIAKEKERLDTEIEIARDIQQNLFPKSIPEIQGYDIACFNRPSAEVGGDYYDVLTVDEHCYGMAIGDVVGKGIGAAMLMSNLQAVLRARAWSIRRPGDLLNRINSDISGRVGEGRFITFCYFLLDSENDILIYSNAGHNPPYLSRAGKIKELEVSGIPLGIFGESRYQDSEEPLSSSDVVILYSDGITECMNEDEEEFGEDRLKTVLASNSDKSAHDISEAIVHAVDVFREEAPSSDDITLVVLKRRPA
jgi:serine phosphatase RsbU (regulator of sigma subunit)/pSer/pThr/pTyr-binding forkhead associated (FHA) protein